MMWKATVLESGAENNINICIYNPVSDATFIFLSFLCVHYYDMFQLTRHHQVLRLLSKTAALYFNFLSLFMPNVGHFVKILF
jgi:hypothetical protein